MTFPRITVVINGKQASHLSSFNLYTVTKDEDLSGKFRKIIEFAIEVKFASSDREKLPQQITKYRDYLDSNGIYALLVVRDRNYHPDNFTPTKDLVEEIDERKTTS